jgi:hypothetical protein
MTARRSTKRKKTDKRTSAGTKPRPGRPLSVGLDMFELAKRAGVSRATVWRFFASRTLRARIHPNNRRALERALADTQGSAV